MPIRSGNLTIPGIVLAPGPVWEEPRVLMREVPRWGVRGLEVLVSQLGARGFSMRVVIHGGNFATHSGGFATKALLRRKLDSIAQAAGTSGNVSIETPGSPPDVYGDCLFLGARATGSEDDGPVRDLGGTLDGGWWQIVVCTWLQTHLPGGGSLNVPFSFF